MILKENLPHNNHDRLCLQMEKNASRVFKLVNKMIIQSIKKALEVEGVAKSEKAKVELLTKAEIPTGWVGEVSLINVDFNKLLGGIIDQYILALNYMLLGQYAGKRAKDAAIYLGLAERIKYPGMAYGAFLSGLDTQAEFYRMLEGKKPDEYPSQTLEVAFKMIQGQVKKMAEDSLDRYKSKMIDVVSAAYRTQDYKNIMASLGALQLDKGESPVGEVVSEASVEEVSLRPIVKSLRELNESAEKDFERIVDTSLTMASSTGNYIGMVSLFGSDGQEMRAALVSIRDDRCCDKCEEFSLNPDGSYKIYPLSAFKPAGTNYHLKQKDWVMTVPGIHPRCRCVLVYCPVGWSINNFGDLVKQ
jgi:hypothetical protein